MSRVLASCAAVLAIVGASFAAWAPAAASAASAPPSAESLARIEHIVVIVAGGRSFDHLFGLFPGADGVAQASWVQRTQVDHSGLPLPSLPPVYVQGRPSARYPAVLPNGPFRIDAPPVSRRADAVLPSLASSFYRQQQQISGGRNNRFVAMGSAGAWAMGYWDASPTRLWHWAQQYTLADHFFMGAFGSRMLNRQWLVCACTPVDAGAPAALRARLDQDGRLQTTPDSPESVMRGPVQVFDGSVTPDGHVVDVMPQRALPPQTARSIADTLDARGIGWAWYGDRQSSPSPFEAFAGFAPGRAGQAGRAAHLRDEADFAAAVDAGTLPPVVFYEPAGHPARPGAAIDLAQEDARLDAVLTRLHDSALWPGLLVIVTWVDNGGYWDHVPPPTGPGWGDRWGPGTRVPTLLISPLARRGHVDPTAYDTGSILKLITRRFRLQPLPGVRANAGDLTNALDLSAPR